MSSVKEVYENLFKIIESEPGLTPKEIAERASMHYNTASAKISALFQTHQIVRVPSKMTFKYYSANRPPKNGALIFEGETPDYIHARLDSVRKAHTKKGGHRRDASTTKHGRLPGEPINPAELPLADSGLKDLTISPTNVKKNCRVLFTLQYGLNESLTLTPDEARDLFESLKVIYG
jgi:hypothetical protein